MPWTAIALAAVLSAADKPKLAVLDVQAVGAPAEDAAALGEAITQELSRRGFFDVISSSDIRALLGVERQKQLLGCGDSNCTAELSGALGARFVLQATLTRLGDALQLSVQMLDTGKSQTVARGVRLASNVRQLAGLLPWCLAEATATPVPPQPSKALPWTLIGVGAASVAGGGIMLVGAYSRELTIYNELTADTGIYQSRATYQSELDTIGRNKRIGFGTLGLGAALVGLGVYLFQRQPDVLALLPTTNGAVLVGVLP